jgi:hypothetical protein
VFQWLVALAIAGALAIFNAVLLIKTMDLSSALSVFVPGTRNLAMLHGESVFDLEERLHIAIEPALQQRVLQGLQTPLGTLSGATLHAWAVWVYTHAFPTWLFAALIWSYLFKRKDFGVLRDLTIIAGFLVVLTYHFFPSAPPRFVLTGAPYNLQDWTHHGSAASATLASVAGFNPFAAFPSVHVLWALIPMVCLVYGCRHVWVWLAAALFPATMFLTVVVTGNHYVLDAAGSVGILALSNTLARGMAWFWRRLPLLLGVTPRRAYTGPDLPAALALALACAGGLAWVSHGTNVRALLALAVLLLVSLAVVQNHTQRESKAGIEGLRGRADLYHYLAGWLFIAGAAALGEPIMVARLGAFLWLLAAACALAAHVGDRRRLFPRGWQQATVADRRAPSPSGR